MKVILSIKPQFAELIFQGTKKFEFRRSIFKNKEVNKVLVYASAPISKIIGEFEISEILKEGIESLWVLTEKDSGISKDYYFKYFSGKETGYAIKVKKVKKYNEQKCIVETYGIRPPQSFAYVKEHKA